MLNSLFSCSSRTVFSRRSIMVYRPHSTRFYMDFASFAWGHEFADSGGMLVE